MVIEPPDPEIAPGLIVQLPEGNPSKTTLPVATAQLGCVTELIEGAAGVAGFAFITILADGGEIHPDAFVTVKLNVPEGNPDRVLLVPEPAIAPGLIIQLPVGRPFNTTLPVATVQVGCVIVPTVGAEGVIGCGRIVKLPDGEDVHPTELVTV